MPRVFISYRRADTSPFAGRLYDRLVAHYGARSVFKDVDDLVAGIEFWDAIVEWVQQMDVMLVLIGPNWRVERLHDDDDFVRREIALGLAQPDCRVIPVLVNGAEMPLAAELPENMRALAAGHAMPLRNDPDFNRDVARLISHIERNATPQPTLIRATSKTESAPRARSRWPISVVIALILMAAVVIGLIALGGDDGTSTQQVVSIKISDMDADLQDGVLIFSVTAEGQEHIESYELRITGLGETWTFSHTPPPYNEIRVPWAIRVGVYAVSLSAYGADGALIASDPGFNMYWDPTVTPQPTPPLGPTP